MTRILLVGLLALASAGCHGHKNSSGPSTPTQGELAVLLTDAPFPHDSLQAVRVRLDRIAIGAGEAAPIVLYEGEALEFELTSLRNGVIVDLVRQSLPVGHYNRLHLHVLDAELSLSDGRQFLSSAGSLLLPEAGPDGLTIALDGDLHIQGGKWSRLLLDIDLTRSFLPVDGEIADATAFSFEPVFYAVMPGQSAEVRGVIADYDEEGIPHPVGSASVYFLPLGSSDLAQAVASTCTDPDGGYCQLGLPPNAYTVVATKGALQKSAETPLVGAGNSYTLDVIFD